MPFIVQPVRGGYKVRKDVPGTPVYFSKSALTRQKAEAQATAIRISEQKRKRT